MIKKSPRPLDGFGSSGGSPAVTCGGLHTPTQTNTPTMLPLFRLSLISLLAGALALAQLPSSTHSASDSTSIGDNAPLHHLDRVVVSTSPLPRSLGEVSQPVSLLEGRRLAQQQSTSLGELLAGEPGVASTYFGPGASRPVVRGIGGDRLKVLENHIGTIDASTTSPDHAVSLDPLLVERVEIVRGPAALLYGGNAIGGVVNVITGRIPSELPASPIGGRVEARSHSASREESAGAVLEGAAGDFAWHLDGFLRETKDLKIPHFAESQRKRIADGSDPAEADYRRVPNTEIENDGGSVGLSWIRESGYIGVSWSGFNTYYGVPGHAHSHGGGHDHGHGHGHDDDDDHHHGHDHGDDHGHEAPVKIDLVQRRFDLAGEINRDLGLLRGAKFALGFADYRHQELADGQVDTVFKNRGHDARLELLHREIAGLNGAFGWHGSQSRFEAIGHEAFVPPSRTTNHALFILEEKPVGPVALQIGGRLEAQDIKLRNGSGRSRKDRLASVSAGALWSLSDDWSLAASASRSERGPGAQERYARGPHLGTRAYEIGSPSLGIETSTALDLTLRKRTGRLTGALTGFVNRFDGYVFEQPTGQVAIAHGDHFHFEPDTHPDADDGLTVYRFAQTDARFLGLEAELTAHLYQGALGNLDLHLATDAVRGKNLKDGGSDLPRITPRRSKVGLEWTRGPLNFGADAQFVAEQRKVAPNEIPTDSYTLIGLYGSYQVTLGPTECTLFVRGTNLGNRDARVHNSFLKELLPLPGRSLNIGLRLAF